MGSLLGGLGIDISYLEDIISIIAVFFGLPLIVIGVLEALFGYKLLKLIRGLIGGFCGALFGAIVGMLSQIANYDNSSFVVAAVVGALVCGAVGAIVNILALYVGVFLEAWVISGIILSIATGSIAAGVILGLVLAIVSIFIFKYSIIIFTAIEGGIVAGNAIGRIVGMIMLVSSDDGIYGYFTGGGSSVGTLTSFLCSVLIIALGLWNQIRKKKKETSSGKTVKVRKYVPYARYILCIVFGTICGLFALVVDGRGTGYIFTVVLIVAAIALLGGMSSRKRNWLLTGSWGAAVCCFLFFVNCLPLDFSSHAGWRVLGLILFIASLVIAAVISAAAAMALQNEEARDRIEDNPYLKGILTYGNRVNAGILAVVLVLCLASVDDVFQYCLVLVLTVLLFGIAERSIYDNRYYHRNRKRASSASAAGAQNFPAADAYDPALNMADRFHGSGEYRQDVEHGREQYDRPVRPGQYSNGRGTPSGTSRMTAAGGTGWDTAQPAYGQKTLEEAFGPELAGVAAGVLTEGDHSRIRYMPRNNQDGSWICTCGNENGAGEEYCMYCGASRTEMKEKLNYRFLSAAAAQIREQEKAEQEAKERRRAEEQKERERRRAEESARRAAAFREQADRQKEQFRHVQRKAGRQTTRAKRKFRRFLRRHPLVIPVVVVIIVAAVITAAVISHFAGRSGTDTASATAASVAASSSEASETASSSAVSSGMETQVTESSGTAGTMADPATDTASGLTSDAGYDNAAETAEADSSQSSGLSTGLSFELLTEEHFHPEYYTVSSAQASSTLDGYPASNLIDGTLQTAWVEGDDGLGTGTTLTLQLSEYETVHGIMLTDGYLKSADLANKNARASRIGISAGGYYGELDLPYPSPYYTANETSLMESELYSEDTAEYYRRLYIISFTNPDQIITDTVTVTILDGVSGTVYDDLAISDIKVY